MLGSAPACPYTYICVRTGSRIAKLFRANRRGNPFKTTSQSKKRPPKPFDAPPGPHIIPGTLRPKTNLQLSPSSKTSITFPYENGSQSADICERVRESASQAARAYRVPTRRFNSPLPSLPPRPPPPPILSVLFSILRLHCEHGLGGPTEVAIHHPLRFSARRMGPYRYALNSSLSGLGFLSSF